jgi:phenylpropionate dioxygenase-like ring-hydroxylating dioxygenase large terminal subunit
MTPSSGNWYPALSSRQLGKRPVGCTRFGEALVFWRSGNEVVCMPDRCPHRGAALSLGQIKGTAIACPFHGLEFDNTGRCTRIPAEKDHRIPDDFGIESLPAHEENGYIWLWRGPSTAPAERPPVPHHEILTGLNYGESSGVWNAHYTRCIENVCDFSHLPFVHRTTIGRFKGETCTDIEIEDLQDGFRAYLIEKGKRKQSLEFLYPNLWLLKISTGMMMSAVFIPIDDHRTQVYGRVFYRWRLPGMRTLMSAYARFSNYLVFREDWPIVASQTPWDVSNARDEKLFPSDAPVIAYRKLHRAFMETSARQEST